MINLQGLSEEQRKQIQEAEEKEQRNREIIKKLVAEGKLPEPRSMSRSERKALDLTGNNIAKIKKDDSRTFAAIQDDMFDWILDNIYKGHNFDSLDNNICSAFALYTYKITFEDDLAAKNS